MSLFHRLLVGGLMTLGLIIGGGMTVSAVWQEPVGAPPGNNVLAPLNQATQFNGNSSSSSFPLVGTFQSPNSVGFGLTPCPSGQTYLYNGNAWACGAAGGSQNLLQVLNNGADATAFTGNITIGSGLGATEFEVTTNSGSAIRAVGQDGNGSNFSLLGIPSFASIVNFASDPNSWSGYFLGGKGVYVDNRISFPGSTSVAGVNTIMTENSDKDLSIYAQEDINFAGSGDFGVYPGSLGAAPLLVVKNNGNIGVGTSDPGYKLHVIAGGGPTPVFAVGNSSLPNQFTIDGDGNIATFGNGFNFKKTNDQQFGGKISSDRGLYININQDTPTDTGEFRINNSAGSSLMVMNNDGNLAIGQNFSVGGPIRLGVLGQILIKDGSEGDGKVLTSDANGAATWKAPAGGGVGTYTAGTNIALVNNAISVIDAPVFSGNITANGEINNTTFSPFYINSNGGLQFRINTQRNVGGIFSVNNSANAPSFVITDRGDVGVGITQPTVGGQVTQSGRYLTVRSTDNYPPRLVLLNDSNSISQLNHAGEILFLAGSGTPKEVGSIRSTLQGSNEDTADIVFSTMNGGSKSQKMIIAANGNVSIGQVAPVAKLNINNSTNVIDFNPASNLASGVTTHGSYGGGYLLHDGNLYAGMWTTGNGTALNISAGGAESGFGSINGQLVLSNGNLGIGTATPAAKLDVVPVSGGRAAYFGGEIYVNNRISFPGNAAVTGANAILTENGNKDLSVYAQEDVNVIIDEQPPAGVGDFGVYLDSPTTAPLFIVKNNGNVGIGITNPSTAKLEVANRAMISGSGPSSLTIRSATLAGSSFDWDFINDPSTQNLILNPSSPTGGQPITIARTGDITSGGSLNFKGGAVVADSANTTRQYLQIDSAAGAPPTADCNNNLRGRMIVDQTNNRLYVCNGATRGWDYIALTN